jgi:cytochrome c biogenesis protein CcmG/thiol:disulfide interchange protein DsbE
MKRLVLLIPLLLFIALALVLYRGLFLDPSELPSALIGKPLPAFALPQVDDPQRTITQADLLGRPALVNVWATWCAACKVEHPLLNQLTQLGVTIYGIDYKDDGAAAQKWLKEFHNPYQLNISDAQGSLGLDLGVYGAPETFLIDAKGIIRHKVVGVIDEQVWREQLAPLYQELIDEAGVVE